MINLQSSNNQKFDLEERTLKFSKELVAIIKKLPNNSINTTLVPQILRSGTSVGANYREANDSLGKKDFVMRTRICRKEAKETVYWLQILLESNQTLNSDLTRLLDECGQLVKIFSSIIKNSS